MFVMKNFFSYELVILFLLFSLQVGLSGEPLAYNVVSYLRSVIKKKLMAPFIDEVQESYFLSLSPQEVLVIARS